MSQSPPVEFGRAPFPRAPLLGAATLVAVALLAVTFTRVSGIGASPNVAATAVAARDLRFEDRSDGGIAVYEAHDNRVVVVVPPGTNGFLRSTLRGLARERKRQGVGPDAPYHLSGRADGRLTLEDPATGRRVDLEAFGATNAGAFSRLLTAQAATY